MVAEIVATFAGGIFAGAAIYVNFVEQPARLSCGIESAVSEWRPSYKRGTLMQAPLALIGSLAAFVAWWFDRHIGWLAGSILLFLVIPFTLVVILPTNKRLESPALNLQSDEAVRLLHRWGWLHAVRSTLSVAAFLAFLITLLKQY
jgi:F0F1-type ATP synthase assembly protein I